MCVHLFGYPVRFFPEVDPDITNVTVQLHASLGLQSDAWESQFTQLQSVHEMLSQRSAELDTNKLTAATPQTLGLAGAFYSWIFRKRSFWNKMSETKILQKQRILKAQLQTWLCQLANSILFLFCSRLLVYNCIVSEALDTSCFFLSPHSPSSRLEADCQAHDPPWSISPQAPILGKIGREICSVQLRPVGPGPPRSHHSVSYGRLAAVLPGHRQFSGVLSVEKSRNGHSFTVIVWRKKDENGQHNYRH